MAVTPSACVLPAAPETRTQRLERVDARRDVESARRLRGHDHVRLAVQLPREDDLLLVPARELPHGHARPRRRDRELAHEPRDELAQRLLPDEPPRRQAAAVLPAEEDVL